MAAASPQFASHSAPWRGLFSRSEVPAVEVAGPGGGDPVAEGDADASTAGSRAARLGIALPHRLPGDMGHAGRVTVVVTEVAGDGGARRGVLDTAGRSDASNCAELAERAALAAPPPYRPVRGRPICEIRAGDTAVWVAEGELAGPLRELVMTALER
jgi:hypothetical protein